MQGVWQLQEPANLTHFVSDLFISPLDCWADDDALTAPAVRISSPCKSCTRRDRTEWCLWLHGARGWQTSFEQVTRSSDQRTVGCGPWLHSSRDETITLCTERSDVTIGSQRPWTCKFPRNTYVDRHHDRFPPFQNMMTTMMTMAVMVTRVETVSSCNAMKHSPRCKCH